MTLREGLWCIADPLGGEGSPQLPEPPRGVGRELQARELDANTGYVGYDPALAGSMRCTFENYEERDIPSYASVTWNISQ